MSVAKGHRSREGSLCDWMCGVMHRCSLRAGHQSLTQQPLSNQCLGMGQNHWDHWARGDSRDSHQVEENTAIPYLHLLSIGPIYLYQKAVYKKGNTRRKHLIIILNICTSGNYFGLLPAAILRSGKYNTQIRLTISSVPQSHNTNLPPLKPNISILKERKITFFQIEY